MPSSSGDEAASHDRTASVPATRSCQIRQRDPPPFSGTADEDVSDWLAQYHRVSSHNAWDETAKLANVVFFLKGTALQWFENHEATLTSWSTFCDCITKLFGRPSQRKHYALQRLSTRAQLPGETCTCYVEDVLFLCRRVDAAMTEVDKVNHIMKGIADDLFNFLAPKSPKTVAEIVEECGKFEEMRNRRLSSGFQRLPQTLATSSPCDTQSLLDLVRRVVAEEIQSIMYASPPAPFARPQTYAQPNDTVAPITLPAPGTEDMFCPQNTTPASRPTYAQVCASRPWQPGLRYAPRFDPPQLASDGPPPYTGSSRTNIWRTPDGRPICYYCRSPGHILRYCRRRPASPPLEHETSAPFQDSRSFPRQSSSGYEAGPRRSRSPSPYPRRRRSSSPMVTAGPN